MGPELKPSLNVFALDGVSITAKIADRPNILLGTEKQWKDQASL